MLSMKINGKAVKVREGRGCVEPLVVFVTKFPVFFNRGA